MAFTIPERLTQIAAGNPQMVQELLGLFLQTLERSLAVLQQPETHMETCQKAVHELKGAADNLGFSLLSAVCAEAEISDNPATFHALTETLTQQHTEISAHLSKAA